MSQDPPNPPESENPEPETPTPQPAEPSPTPARGVNRRRSPLKAGAIAALRSTINVLEGVVEKLEAEPARPILTPDRALEPSPGILSQVLAPIRALLPSSLNRALSDWGLTGAIALILALVTWTTTTLLSPKPPEVAQVLPPQPAKQIPEIPTEIPPEIPPAAPEIPPQKQAPPEVKKPEPPPVTTVPPQPELTPEQSLIAGIQNQVAQVTSQYADIPIASIQADFEASRLLVQISNEWYNLSFSRQDKLAAQMLDRARDLDFTTVEITDSQGNLLARSPVVGSQMIILKRQQG